MAHVNTLALVKGTERYVFRYADGCQCDVLRTLGQYASNPELSFTWLDAAHLSVKVRGKSVMEDMMDARGVMP